MRRLPLLLLLTACNCEETSVPLDRDSGIPPPIVDCFGACCDVDCSNVILPGCVEIAEPTPFRDGCVCTPTQCADSCELLGGACLPVDDFCDDCFEFSMGTCFPVEVSCYDRWECELCWPTNCEEQPFAADGTPLEPLGKCVGGGPPPPDELCTQACHDGIEDPHPWFGGPDLTCTGCHGGDPDQPTRELAHVPLPAAWQMNSPQVGRPNLRYYWNYLTLNGVENFDGGLEWLRFRNPSDLRIGEQSCGKDTGCHQDRVENVRRSVMGTSVGLLSNARAGSGLARQVVRSGSASYKWDATTGMTFGWEELLAMTTPSRVGAVERIVRFRTANRDLASYDQIAVLEEVYDKACANCHLGSAGRNDRFGDFRGSGCAACHGNYDLDGRSRSQDPMMLKTEPTYPIAYENIANFDKNDLNNLNGTWLGPERPHPRSHRITSFIPSSRCATCHYGSNQTEWQYRGVQTDPNRVLVRALDAARIRPDQLQLSGEIDNDANPFARYHGLAQEQLIQFVDLDDDGLDDTPADIHWQSGLECVDCHTSAEMHNELQDVHVAQVTDWTDPAQVTDQSGALWSHMGHATEIECSSCHGSLEARAVPFAADNRNPIKTLVACPEVGETIDNYTPPAECQQLGRGRWLKARVSGRWHYVPQTYDTVTDFGTGTGGGATRPNGGPVYTLNAATFHGRDTNGFSHLGEAAEHPADEGDGGLECYACHATWANHCYGCHIKLADTDGNVLLRDFTPSTGEYTLGAVVEQDLTMVSALDIQLGINGDGKISQLLPESKQHVAHQDVDNNAFFGTQVIVNNDTNIQYNIYRHRSGYGLRQYATEQVGLPPGTDGPVFDQLPEMDENAGQGAQPMMPHTVQRSHPRMDCTHCHLREDGANNAAIAARYGYRDLGFGGVSAYLAIAGEIVREEAQVSYITDPAEGFRFDANTDPIGFVVDQQADWLVRTDGFPLVYTNQLIRRPTPYLRLFPSYLPTDASTAGPLSGGLIQKLQQTTASDVGVRFRGVR